MDREPTKIIIDNGKDVVKYFDYNFDILSNGTIMCDDYNFGHLPDVKNAIDEFVKNNNLNCQILCDGRFAKIEK